MSRVRLSYDHCPSPVPFLGETIGRCLLRTATSLPDRPALIGRHQDVRLTWAELRDRAVECARGLLGAGIGRGDRVAVWSTNCVEWAVTQYGTALIGALLVTINPAYRLHELGYVLRASRARTLVLGEGFRETSYPELLYELAPSLRSRPPGQTLADPPPELPALRSVLLIGEKGRAGMVRYADLPALGVQLDDDAVTAAEAALDIDDDINIQYTSGTTGAPKGVTLTHHNILTNAYFTARTMNLGPDDRLCVPVPFYHCFGMVLGTLCCLTSGACMVLPSPWFDPALTLAAVAQEGCTALHGVPTMFIAELAEPSFAAYDLSSLRTGVMAGAPCPIELMHEVMERMHLAEILIGYGQTEASPIATLTRPDDPPQKRAETVGRTTPHQELKIVDPVTGVTVPRGTPGDICFRGYHVMARYDHDPAATAAVVDPQGWLHSGDLGVMDDDGYVKIVGRLKEMVIRGGENIYPREIEEFLHTLDIILDAYVVGVPDLKYGEELAACVRLAPGVLASGADRGGAGRAGAATEGGVAGVQAPAAVPTPDGFRELCRGKIASFKIPRYWLVMEEFPMTVTGKVQKYKLREMAVQTLGLEDAAAVKTA